MRIMDYLKQCKYEGKMLKQEQKGKDVIIFAVTGFSGSGKTTAIDAMRDHLRKQGKKVMRIKIEKYFLPFGFSSLRNFKLFVKRIKTFAYQVERLRKEPDYLDDYNDAMSKFVNTKVLKKLAESKGFDAYTIEGVQMPKDIWNNANCRIVVDADIENRSQAVRKRWKDGKWTRDDNLAAQRQLEQTKFRDLSTKNATHILFNEHNGFAKLNQDAVNICNEVLNNGKNLTHNNLNFLC